MFTQNPAADELHWEFFAVLPNIDIFKCQVLFRGKQPTLLVFPYNRSHIEGAEPGGEHSVRQGC